MVFSSIKAATKMKACATKQYNTVPNSQIDICFLNIVLRGHLVVAEADRVGGNVLRHGPAAHCG